MKEPPDEKTKAEIAERLFVHWNDRQEDDSNNEGIEDDPGPTDEDTEDGSPDPE